MLLLNYTIVHYSTISIFSRYYTIRLAVSDNLCGRTYFIITLRNNKNNIYPRTYILLYTISGNENRM